MKTTEQEQRFYIMDLDYGEVAKWSYEDGYISYNDAIKDLLESVSTLVESYEVDMAKEFSQSEFDDFYNQYEIQKY